MQYFDKNGKEIKAGMKILMDDGSIEMVYDTDDQYGNPSLGINASNEEFLKLHPNWAREYYSLSNFNPSSIEICPSEQEIRDELEQLTPIIEGTELRLDYGEKVSKEDYEKYEAAIARRTTLTSMLGEDTPISAKIDRFNDNPDAKIKANASVTIGTHFAVHGLKIYDGDDGKGPRVMYPSTKGTDGKYYDDFHPVTKEAREAMDKYVLDAYQQALEQTQGEQTATETESEDLDEDEEPAFEQTM